VPRTARVRKQKNTNIRTTTNLNPATQRMRVGAYSAPSLSTVQGYILEEARTELRFPRSTAIYKTMLLDANIAAALNIIEVMISRVAWEVVVPKDASEEEQTRAEQLNYNMLTMERPWEEYIGETLSYLTYGFHTPEKLYEKFVGTPVGDFVGWKDFRTISQDTVSKWIFDKQSGTLAGLKQDTNRIPSDFRTTVGTGEVPRKKFMLFRNAPKRDNPEGVSPLKSCYVSWKYRSLIEELETIGVSKDFGGTPLIGVDVAYLAKASADHTSPEASVVQELKTQAANLHVGEQSYGIIPIAYDDKGKPLFTFDLKGIEGGGKQYDSSEIVKRHDTKILMTFLADVLKLGSDQHGSFALAENKNSLLAMGIEHHLKNIQRTLNHDLIRQTYELNGWDFDPRKACRFEFGDLEDRDIDTLSKSLQRVAATNLLRPTEDIEDTIRCKFLDLPPLKESDTTLLPVVAMVSRSGDGMASGLNDGVGESSSEGDDNSISNKEN